VWIVDRVADRFDNDGQPVYPSDVERVLARHPRVDNAAVVPVAHQGGGLAVAAFVVPTAGSPTSELDILDFARRHLPAHQTPTSVTFLDHLPRNSVGKLQRAQLHALASPPSPPPETPGHSAEGPPRRQDRRKNEDPEHAGVRQRRVHQTRRNIVRAWRSSTANGRKATARHPQSGPPRSPRWRHPSTNGRPNAPEPRHHPAPGPAQPTWPPDGRARRLRRPCPRLHSPAAGPGHAATAGSPTKRPHLPPTVRLRRSLGWRGCGLWGRRSQGQLRCRTSG
jgi:hypothetical protein